MKDEWVQIKNYENYYINNIGQIKSVDHLVYHSNGRHRIQKGRILKTHKCKKGYIRVYLISKNKKIHTSVHRILALTFIPNPENKPQVNHINGVKDDNRIENLEWVTNKENQIHAIKNKLVKHNKGVKHHLSLFKKDDVISIRNRYKNGETLKEISKDYNTSATVIMNCVKKITYNNI